MSYYTVVYAPDTSSCIGYVSCGVLTFTSAQKITEVTVTANNHLHLSDSYNSDFGCIDSISFKTDDNQI